MTLLDTAQAVALLLPGEWKAEEALENWSGVFIQSSDGKKLYLQDYNSRLEINGSFDSGLSQYLSYAEAREKTEITVAATRAPEQIAKAIISRLLPPYERMLAKCKEGKARDDEYISRRNAVVNQVLNALPGTRTYPYEVNRVYFPAPYYGNAGCYPDRVHIEIELPPDTAVKMLMWLSGNPG
jgi:hypothetical protein